MILIRAKGDTIPRTVRGHLLIPGQPLTLERAEAEQLEDELRQLGVSGQYVIQLCPDHQPFKYQVPQPPRRPRTRKG